MPSACPRFYTLMKMGTFGHIPELKICTQCSNQIPKFTPSHNYRNDTQISKPNNTHCSCIYDACKNVYTRTYGYAGLMVARYKAITFIPKYQLIGLLHLIACAKKCCVMQKKNKGIRNSSIKDVLFNFS